MNKNRFSILLTLFLAACTSTTPQQASVPKVSNQEGISKSVFPYEPKGREEFVFGKVHPDLQKYAYDDVCYKMPVNSVTMECLLNRLPYEKYVGKKGYYTDRAPFEDRYDSIVREAVLETGEMIYLVKSKKYRHVGDKIISLAKHEKISGFKPKPIVPGASVMITGYSLISGEKLNVSSQNGHSFTESEIEAIQRVAAKYPTNSARIADLLTTLRVKYDDFEKRTLVSHLPYNNKASFISLRLVINDDGNYYPFVVIHYQAEEWLFASRYSVSADGYRWDSPSLDFEKDHSGGAVWEWNTSAVNDEYLNMLGKMSKASAAKIRFHGSKYYSDFELTAEQKKELAALVEVANLLKQK